MMHERERGLGRREARRYLRTVFPRKRLWAPTEGWRRAMLSNLARAPRLRSPEESWQIKQAVRDWLALPLEQRPAQQDLARKLGVSKQYICRLVHGLPPRQDFPQCPAERPALAEPQPGSHERMPRPIAASPPRCPRCNVLVTTWPCLWCAAQH